MRRFCCLLLALCLLVVPALAHPGRTDSQGGHIDKSTGEYHYHHGFPAHQHPDGVCPYAEATDPPSRVSASLIGSASAERPGVTYRPAPTPSIHSRSSSTGLNIFYYVVIGVFGIAVLFFFVPLIVSVLTELIGTPIKNHFAKRKNKK